MNAEFTFPIVTETTAQVVERSRTQLLNARARLLAGGRRHTIAVLDVDNRHVAEVSFDPNEGGLPSHLLQRSSAVRLSQ